MNIEMQIYIFKENGTSIGMCTINNGKVNITGSNGRIKGVKLYN